MADWARANLRDRSTPYQRIFTLPNFIQPIEPL